MPPPNWPPPNGRVPSSMVRPRGYTDELGHGPQENPAMINLNQRIKENKFTAFNGIPVHFKSGKNLMTPPVSGQFVNGARPNPATCLMCSKIGHFGWECPTARYFFHKGNIDANCNFIRG